MNGEAFKDLLGKIPVLPVFFLGLGYFAYDFYSFSSDGASPLMQKRAQVTAIRAENTKLQEQVKKAQEFYKSLDRKREDLKALAQQLDQMRATLSDSLDIPQFIKMVITEAGKVGIRVLSIKPTESKKHEYYVEQAFDVSFRGVYLQTLVFLDRLASLERIIRVDNFDIKRQGSSLSQYVELGGTIQVKAFKYLGSKADDLVKTGGSVTANGAPATAAPGAAPAASAAPAKPATAGGTP